MKWSDRDFRRGLGKSNAFLWITILGMATGLAGCGESKLRVYPVAGKLVWGGEPVPGALVILRPTGKPLPEKLVPSATTDAAGNFKITSYASSDGAPVGDYVATAVWLKLVDKGEQSHAGPNVLPAEYSKAETSPLKVTIAAKPNELQPFEIPR